MALIDHPASSVSTTLAEGILTISVSARVVLDGELDCSTERRVKFWITRLAETADVIEIDARQVAFIDAAGVRTLLLAKRDALKNGAEVSVEVTRPGPVERILQLVGLDDLLSSPKE